MRKLLRLLPVLALLALVGVASAVDPVTLPDTGVDPAAYSSALVTKLGAVLGVAIGGGFAIFAIIKGYHYIKAMMGGSKG